MILTAGTEVHTRDHRYRREPGFAAWTVTMVLHGATRMESSGRHALIPEGHIALIAPRTPYTLSWGGGNAWGGNNAWGETWVVFQAHPDWEDLLTWEPLLPGMTMIACAGQGGPAIAAALTEAAAATTADPLRVRLAENLLEQALLRARLRLPHDAMHPGIRAVRDHISAVPEERTSAAALARRAGLAPSRFHQLFAQQVGHTPMRFQEECRMDRARRLLLSGELPVAAIAEACGYGDAFHFSARFHKVVGCSPSAYRIRPR